MFQVPLQDATHQKCFQQKQLLAVLPGLFGDQILNMLHIDQLFFEDTDYAITLIQTHGPNANNFHSLIEEYETTI